MSLNFRGVSFLEMSDEDSDTRDVRSSSRHIYVDKFTKFDNGFLVVQRVRSIGVKGEELLISLRILVEATREELAAHYIERVLEYRLSSDNGQATEGTLQILTRLDEGAAEEP